MRRRSPRAAFGGFRRVDITPRLAVESGRHFFTTAKSTKKERPCRDQITHPASVLDIVPQRGRPERAGRGLGRGSTLALCCRPWGTQRAGAEQRHRPAPPAQAERRFGSEVLSLGSFALRRGRGRRACGAAEKRPPPAWSPRSRRRRPRTDTREDYDEELHVASQSQATHHCQSDSHSGPVPLRWHLPSPPRHLAPLARQYCTYRRQRGCRSLPALRPPVPAVPSLLPSRPPRPKRSGVAGAEPAGRRSGQAGRLPYVRGSGRTASPGMAIDRFTVCVIISSIISTISLIEKRCEPPTSCAGGRREWG